MKKLYPLLSVLFLIYWGCDDPKEENKPTPVTPSITDNTIKWTMNKDTDFFRYSLYGLNDSSMENRTLIYETQTRLDTTYTLESSEKYSSYQVDVMNLNESVSSSNILNVFVYLWGRYYSIENTTQLGLGGNQFTGEIPPEIGNLTNLEILRLFIPLTGSIPSEIGNLTNLTELYLGGINQLTGSIPPEIGNLTNLTILVLHDNQLTGSIPPEIGNLTNLKFLELYRSNLTGSIPSEIWNLTNLVGLYLNSNQLTGEIPSEIGNLTNLEWVNLHSNQLTGSIPSEIGNLTNLERVNLHSNQLTGEIPESICDLNIDWMDGNMFGYYSEIYYNQLCPPYPSCIENNVGEQDTTNCD